MAKVNFLNHNSFKLESYISQLHGNANKKTRKWEVLYLGSNEKKNSGREVDKIEAILAESK